MPTGKLQLANFLPSGWVGEESFHHRLAACLLKFLAASRGAGLSSLRDPGAGHSLRCSQGTHPPAVPKFPIF